MTRLSLAVVLILLAVISGCSTTPWEKGRRVTLSPRGARAPSGLETLGAGGEPVAAPLLASSRAVILTVPADWFWIRRGDDLVATRDGVFLQNLTVERFHIESKKQSEYMNLISFTSWRWPLRTLNYLPAPLAATMSPAELVDALLASRTATPGVSGLSVRERGTTLLAGWPAGRVEYDFRLAVQGRQTLYRASSVIAMAGEWCYVVTGVAAARFYYERDGAALATIAGSLRFRETGGEGGGE